MKLRILSDLHLDINKDIKFTLKDKNTFTIICGDISGYYNDVSKWLNQNVKEGVFVSGNHIFYNESYHSLQYFKARYNKAYPLSSKVSFLDDTFKIVDDIVFVGGTLWTDYKLLGDAQQSLYMWYATKNLNDFRYAKFNNSKDVENEDTNHLITMKPEDCAIMFENTINKINEVCLKFPDKKIVVITHHAPSMLSIPQIYKNDVTSPCFASNLENFILEHTNIKLWCHGHIHSTSDYNIGDCRVVCNPRGYEKYKEKTDFKKDFIIEV